MKFLHDRLTKGQKISIVVLFTPAAFLLLGAIDPFKYEVARFWSNVILLVWGYLILGLIFRTFFDKHISKISYLYAIMFISFSALCLGDISSRERWHWEPDKPIVHRSLSNMNVWFCGFDFDSFRKGEVSHIPNIKVYISGVVELDYLLLLLDDFHYLLLLT